jgi:hypothetical protein
LPLADCALRQAHRRTADHIEDVPIAAVAVGDELMPAGEVVSVYGVLATRNRRQGPRRPARGSQRQAAIMAAE